MKKIIGKAVQYIILYTLAALVMLPLINIILSCLKSNADISRVQLLPTSLNFENFTTVFKAGVLVPGFTNSIIITGVSLFFAVLVCALAAHPLARRKEKVYSFIYLFFLSSMMIPAAANLVPVYKILNGLGLINTRTGMVLIYIAGSIPMGILLYSGFIKTIPRELEEAANIDGCNYFQSFMTTVLPLLKPVTVAFIVISILGIWNDFMMPMLLLQSKEKQTITLAVYTFQHEKETDWGAVYALMTIAVLPPILLFLLGQKHFYKGMTLGAVKG